VRSPRSPYEISDERVHRVDTVGPRSRRGGQPDTLIDLPFPSDLVPDTRELVGHPLIHFHDFVESLCDFSVDPDQIHGQTTEKSPFLNARSALKSPCGK